MITRISIGLHPDAATKITLQIGPDRRYTEDTASPSIKAESASRY
jgi:hypothetical protein